MYAHVHELIPFTVTPSAIKTFNYCIMAAARIPRLFVGNLPWTIGVRELREYFTQFGYVSTVNVVFDKDSGMSRGFGFVQFGAQEGYNNATAKVSHVLESSMIALQPAQGTN